MPDAFKDFDVDLKNVERNPEEYRNSYNAVQKETFWMTFLQMVSNVFLLGPLFIAGDLKTFSWTVYHKYFLSFQSGWETHCSRPLGEEAETQPLCSRQVNLYIFFN